MFHGVNLRARSGPPPDPNSGSTASPRHIRTERNPCHKANAFSREHIQTFSSRAKNIFAGGSSSASNSHPLWCPSLAFRGWFRKIRQSCGLQATSGVRLLFWESITFTTKLLFEPWCQSFQHIVFCGGGSLNSHSRWAHNRTFLVRSLFRPNAQAVDVYKAVRWLQTRAGKTNGTCESLTIVFDPHTRFLHLIVGFIMCSARCGRLTIAVCDRHRLQKTAHDKSNN